MDGANRALSVALLGVFAGCPLNPDVSLGGDDRPPARVILPDDSVPETRDTGPRPRPDTTDAGVALIDLSLERMADAPRQLRPEQPTPTSFIVRGRGFASSPPTSILVEFVPEDPSIDDRVFEVGLLLVPTLGPDDEVMIEGDITVPSPALPMFYSLRARVDPFERIVELDETNNFLRSPPIALSSVDINPTDIDFGTVGLDCQARRQVFVTNNGKDRAFVSGVRLSGAPAYALGVVEPARLFSGGSLGFDVFFTPRQAGRHETTVFVEHEQFLSPVRIPVRGFSIKDPARTDFFEQWRRPHIDILFVVDDSQSMEARRAQLSRQASTFFKYLVASAIDFQVGITTTWVEGAQGGELLDPANIGGVLRPSTPNGPHLFESTLEVPYRPDRAEQGLAAAVQAVSEPNRSGANAGLLRTDASLAVIIISDQEDESPEAVDDYRRGLAAARYPGGSARVVVNAVVPPEGGCTGSPDGGSRYLDLVRQTGGTAESICEFDWTTALRTFPGPGFGFRSRFQLQRPPLNPDAIEVLVNGTPLPRQGVGRPNWTYSTETNEVVFDPIAIPEPGAFIEIDYNSEC